LLERKPKALSGGQRQRVAIGRTLVAEPRVFLLDEPLSNLDAALRVQMRIEISRLHKRLGRTMIYVTHDQVEAMTLADKIVVLDAGRVAQVGKPLALSLSGRPLCRRVYWFAKNEFPAGESDGAPPLNRSRSSCLTASRSGCRSTAPMCRSAAICHSVFALNTCCPATSPMSPWKVKFRSSNS
jgi:ABC-type sulfate/molybdate transport systems ATPase subunit